MAFLARSLLRPGGECALVEVRVAIHTGGELQLLTFLPGGMAFVAGDTKVATFERISGLAVIKLGFVDYMPSLGAMTINAVGAKFPFVNVGVTVGALLVWNRLEFQILSIIDRAVINDSCMAFAAQNRNVLAN